MTNTKMLRDIIKRKGVKYCHIANELGITPYSLQKKIDGITDFKGQEIAKISKLLQLNTEEMNGIFFALFVAK